MRDAQHDQEHSTWNRRSFLQALGLVGGGTMMLGGANLSASSPTRLTAALAAAEISDRACLLYTSPSPRDRQKSRMPSSA